MTSTLLTPPDIAARIAAYVEVEHLPDRRLSVIVPAFDEERTIVRCLDALLRQSAPVFEIIVVDNRSTDSTAALVREMQATHFAARIRLASQDTIQGLVPTRNLGFDLARGEILGRIDADTVVDRDWAFRTMRHLDRTRASAVSGPVGYYDMPLPRVSRILDDMTRRSLRGGPRTSPFPFLYGSNMAITASAWHLIKQDTCVDDDDRLHEDIDLALHLREHGLSISYERRMRATVSARRLDSAPADFHDYTRRFERTYESHGIRGRRIAVPRILLDTLYRPFRPLHRLVAGDRTFSGPARRAAVTSAVTS